MRYLVALFILLAELSSAVALEPPASAMVREVIDGDTVVIEGGGEIRLVGIQAPKLPLGRRGFVAWPLAEEAKAALARMVLGRRVALTFGGRRMDRHGRWLAHLTDPTGRWVQGEMLAAGLARVYTFADNRARAADMLGIEAAARQARRGLWAHSFYAILPAGAAEGHDDTYQLVEGVVRKVAEVRGRTYLNFGDDHRSDFTAVAETPARRLFREVGVDLEQLAGRRVRVRGWMKDWNGPMIDISHPEQIEVLE